MTLRMITPRQLAEAIGVSESSLKRWSDAGKIAVSRTEGGHRRIPIGEAVRFIRATRAQVLRPELLGLPAVTGHHEALTDLLASGQTKVVIAHLAGQFLDGVPVAALCDGPLRAAMTRIGELWRESPSGVMVEHRATAVCVDVLASVRTLLPDAPAEAKVAVGGAPPGDPYLVPSMMCATALQDVGMRAINLGPDSPLAVIARAAREERAALAWVSMTSPLDAKTAAELEPFCEELSAAGTIVVIGGRQREHMVVPRAARSAGTIGELVAIATELKLVALTPRLARDPDADDRIAR